MNKQSDKEQTKAEYLLLLDIFKRMLDGYEDNSHRWEVMYDLTSHRFSFLFDRVLTGMKLDFDQALTLIRNHNDFTTYQEREQRDILLAAIDNLIEFAAVEEYSMLDDLPDEFDEDDLDIFESTFSKYNLLNALTENRDVLYAATIAAWWVSMSPETLVTFMTQGDERVRDSHLALEGESYYKREFPSELIPPIEWGCRCYLINDGYSSVVGSLNNRPSFEVINPIFYESLATGGRIFTDHHPYFRTARPKLLQDIINRLKSKFQNL